MILTRYSPRFTRWADGSFAVEVLNAAAARAARTITAETMYVFFMSLNLVIPETFSY
jgi:hypothetical protein